MIIDYQQDLANKRCFAMWGAVGLQFRSNVITEVGGLVPLHSHNYDHIAIITQGTFNMIVDGKVTTEKAGAKIPILKWAQHSFELIDHAPGEVLCIWPEDK